MTNEARITRKIPGVFVPAHGLFVLLLATGLMDLREDISEKKRFLSGIARFT